MGEIEIERLGERSEGDTEGETESSKYRSIAELAWRVGRRHDPGPMRLAANSAHFGQAGSSKAFVRVREGTREEIFVVVVSFFFHFYFNLNICSHMVICGKV